MNETITIDGQDYEVLSLDRISEITHARLAGGAVVRARRCREHSISWDYEDGQMDSAYHSRLEDLGIQPLKLIERVPVEFIGVVYSGAGNPYVLAPMGTPSGMKFRCVQITEEA